MQIDSQKIDQYTNGHNTYITFNGTRIIRIDHQEKELAIYDETDGPAFLVSLRQDVA